MTKEKQPLEEDIKKLHKIVEDLSGGKLTLGEALKKYEEGIKLAESCSQALQDAETKVSSLMKKDGKFSLQDFSEDDRGKG
ncbi:MAG: exodeoxyribonuclease VII small subunit [Candidatus Omnitrophota bacterium]